MMDANQTALIRSWIQGVSWEILSELYLGDAERADVLRALRQLRERLAIKAPD